MSTFITLYHELYQGTEKWWWVCTSLLRIMHHNFLTNGLWFVRWLQCSMPFQYLLYTHTVSVFNMFAIRQVNWTKSIHAWKMCRCWRCLVRFKWSKEINLRFLQWILELQISSKISNIFAHTNILQTSSTHLVKSSI